MSRPEWEWRLRCKRSRDSAGWRRRVEQCRHSSPVGPDASWFCAVEYGEFLYLHASGQHCFQPGVELSRIAVPEDFLDLALFKLDAFQRRRTRWVDSVRAIATSFRKSDRRRGRKSSRQNQNLELCVGWERRDLALKA